MDELMKLRDDVQSGRKEEERSLKREKGRKYGSATESDSEAESDEGFEYPVEEINTNEEDSDVAEDKRKMQRYLDWKLRRRFEFERANPNIFSRTMHEGEPKVEEKSHVRIFPRSAHVEESSESDEDLPDVSRDEDEEDSDEESSSYGDNDTSLASSGSSYSEWYEGDEDWSYDEEDF
ncbi:VID27-like protein [Papaver somniferum]|uniref:VID27-like protein n=1 Tax=Papaver somniferum TaxID=3469 RepID=UPI000E6F5841|nr:VID27-like protein [Papaver somniferum]